MAAQLIQKCVKAGQIKFRIIKNEMYKSSFLYSFADGRPLGLPDATYFFAVPDPAGLPLGLPVGT